MNPATLELVARQAVATQRRAGAIALVALALAALVFVFATFPLLGAVLASSGRPVEAVGAERLTPRQAEFQSLLTRSSESIVSREPWGKVGLGRPAPRPSGPPAAPTRYAGPAIVGIVADTVWFADGKHVRVGQSADGFGSVAVLSVDAPWSARVRWMDGEFTVSLFDRDVSKWTQPLSVWSGPPPIVAAAPAPSGPAAPGGPANGRPPGTPPAGGPAGAAAAAPGAARPGLPPGAVITGPTGALLAPGVQIIQGEGGGTMVITSSSPAAPPPPPPPPDDEPEKK